MSISRGRFLALIAKDIISLILVDPGLFFLSAFITFAASVSQIAVILSNQWLFDSIEQNVETSVIGFCVFFFTSKVINALLAPSIKIMDTPLENKMFASLATKLDLEIANLEPLYFEDSNNLDTIEKARKATASLPQVIILLKWLVFYYCPFFALMAQYLWHLRPVLVLCILFILIPMAISQLYNYFPAKKYIDESVRYARITKYYQVELTEVSHVKETQVLGINGFIFDKYVNSITKCCEKSLEYENKSVIIQVFSLILFLAGYTMSILLLYSSLCDGYITIGAFSAVFSSLGDLLLFTHMFVKVYIKRVMENIAHSKNLYITPTKEDDNPPVVDEICLPAFVEFNHVSFTYPGAKDAALHNLCFKIRENETIVIVGENGAGKSTMANIILGNYSPTSGSVNYGGKNLYDYPVKVRARFKSGVVQHFGKFKLTLRDNISLSDRQCKVLDTAVEEACIKAEIPNKFYLTYKDIILAKEYGGIDLSGGQWQSIAIARGAYKRANLLVLDEPVSAIDPLTESKIYSSYLSLSKNRTTIIISHRLGCVSFADRVMFLSRGRIKGFDTHENLLRTNKDYADLYTSQAQWYVNVEKEIINNRVNANDDEKTS